MKLCLPDGTITTIAVGDAITTKMHHRGPRELMRGTVTITRGNQKLGVLTDAGIRNEFTLDGSRPEDDTALIGAIMADTKWDRTADPIERSFTLTITHVSQLVLPPAS